MEALATSEMARRERDRAIADAERAHQQALRLEGQPAQVTADKKKLAAHSAAIEGELFTAEARNAVETALRQRCEADLVVSAGEMKTLRSEFAAKVEEQAEIISQIKESLGVEQQRIAALQDLDLQ